MLNFYGMELDDLSKSVKRSKNYEERYENLLR